jgi:hypothetical protein
MNRYGLGLLCCLVLTAANPIQAGELQGVEMPDTVTVEDTPLELNGMGMRLATLLKIEVYVLGFYLELPGSDAQAILASDERKRIVMHFLRDVGAEDLRGAWQEGFEKNVPDLQAISAHIDQFNSSMQDVKKGDEMVVDFGNNQVRVSVRGEEVAQIEGQDFERATLAIWLGPEPPNKELKAGMLGEG